MVFQQNLIEKAYFIAKMSGPTMVRPASSDFWKAPWDEYNNENEIFSILSITRAWTNVILAGKRDIRRHSTTSFSENVVVAGTSYQI